MPATVATKADLAYTHTIVGIAFEVAMGRARAGSGRDHRSIQSDPLGEVAHGEAA